jgi:predicted negative regulator of RcsB-dependent stress response
MSLNHFALILGMFLGLMTFVVTWVYKHKTYKLQQQYSQHYQDVDKTITYNKRYSQEAEAHGGAETPKNG